MKIALLTAKPNWTRKIDGHKMYVGEKRPPHGIGFLARILEQEGFDVDIFDRYCGDQRWPKDNFASYNFLGLYTTTVCSSDIGNIIEKAKAQRIAVGGPHAHLFPETIPDKVDHIVRGEAEKIIVDLVQGKYSDRIIKTERLSDAELDAIPRFPYEIFYEHRRDLYDWDFPFHDVTPVFTLNTSRGCPFRCSFCSVKKVWGHRLTAMSAERVLSDIDYVAKLGAKAVYFREDNFTVKKKRLVELCTSLAKRNDKMLWACETRVDTVDEETMGLMHDAGCIGFYVGVEHLSQCMLDHFNKDITVDQIMSFFKNTRKYGVFTHASFIINHPKETERDKQLLKERIKELNPSVVINNTYRENG